VPKKNIIHQLRSWLADRLQIQDEAARRGEWWEIDFIIVIFLGAIVIGIHAWGQM
jgi:hypothetical protein